MVALPTPRGASPAVWGQSHASGPKGRVRRVGSQRRRAAIADALRIVGVWVCVSKIMTEHLSSLAAAD